jgi:hypothetical protein
MEDYETKYDIESVITKISNEYSVDVKINRFSLVETRKFEDIYIARAENFQQKRGYPAELFENIVSALKTVTNERIGFLSLEINKDYDGFALVDIGRIIFYSGIIAKGRVSD